MDDGSTINLTTYFTTSPVYTVTTNPVESNVGVMSTGSIWYAPVNFALNPMIPVGRPQFSHLSIDSPQYPWSSNTYFDFSSWSNGGAQTQTITRRAAVPPTLPTSPAIITLMITRGRLLRRDDQRHAAIDRERLLPDRQLITFAETSATGWSSPVGSTT
jgi:hypothetical protein